jgi:acetyltransferase-like isoleucine patch superfamily enzyme
MEIFGPKGRFKTITKIEYLANTICNTENGNIFIDEDSFTGHNVMLLTGYHDYNKFGKDRIKVSEIRDRHIIIGKGVWICSGCIIIGPCYIEDNAVIGAGSIVKAGTIISHNELWAGNPAKYIKTICKDK